MGSQDGCSIQRATVRKQATKKQARASGRGGRICGDILDGQVNRLIQDHAAEVGGDGANYYMAQARPVESNALLGGGQRAGRHARSLDMSVSL